MLHPTIVTAICFAGMVCVSPVAFYLCWLASVNRRPRPTVVNGAWDFVGVLAALSGFLLVGGMLLLGIVQNNPLLFPELFGEGSFEGLRGVFEKQWLSWVTVFAGYLGVIGLAAMSGMRGRAGWLSVYNVDVAVADTVVHQVVSRVELPAGRKPVEVIPFHATRHVTVRILTPQASDRAELDRRIRAAMGQIASPENPAASWVSALAGGAVLTVVMFVGLLFYIIYARY